MDKGKKRILGVVLVAVLTWAVSTYVIKPAVAALLGA
jgi:hypothetical protein